MNVARTNDVERARASVLANVKITKAEVIATLENGYRDWPALRASLEAYIDYQTAADVLGGMTKIETK